MVYVIKIVWLVVGFLIIPHTFSSYELLGSELDKENGCRNRKNVSALKSPPVFKERTAASTSSEVSELQDLERHFRQAFITQQRSYNLLEMIRALNAVYKDEIAFKSRARNFKVYEPEYLQFLWHCCKEVDEKEEELKKELRKEKKELRYFHTNAIIMEVIKKNTDWNR